MGSHNRAKKRSLDQYEAYSVLSTGCRHLARTCVTRGARKILQRLADQFDRQAREVEEARAPALCLARVATPARRGAAVRRG
jgi:hypothetical protein